MALPNISSDCLNADSNGGYMLLQNGDDFDLHLTPFRDFEHFEEAKKLLDVTTPDGEICKVVLDRRTYCSTLEVAYVLKIYRRSRNCLTTLPKEVRRIIFKPCLQYYRYAPEEEFLPTPAALQWWSRPRDEAINSPANLQEVL
ncbi:hypothetical protein NU219Hw_g295t1 [Hortaea werneckii]